MDIVSKGKGSATTASNAASAASSTSAALLRVAFFVIAVVLGWLLVELPWNDNIIGIAPSYAAANLAIVALLGGIVFLIGQRTRISLAVFVALCLFIGVANFYIITFKGQPILPADLFALSTAASVAGGYTLFLTPRLVGCLLAFAAFCVALRLWCPARHITRWDVIVNCIAAALLIAFCAIKYQSTDIKSEFNVTVDVWDVRGSYGSQGTLLCFLSRAQELTPAEPEGFSDEVLSHVLEPFESSAHQSASSALAAKDGAAQSAEGAEGSKTAADTAKLPNVIAIMNETFSDLSSYPGLEGSNAQPAYFKEVQADSLVAGDLYVSAMGGGTCNSEFEFLTGSSMGNMGGGVYPYVLYDLDGTENLAAYFDRLGYDTHAIHPAEASNWRRDRIYEQLGFDSFDDITTMEGADTFRDLVTDKATYERVLEKIDAGDGPQFVFDVTIQNHGGYDTGLVPEEDQVHLDSDAVDNPEIDEFLAAMHQSDEDLRWLIDELNKRDEPTIVVFFGDHQPGFADWLFEHTYNKSVDDATIEEVQARYHTPYFIWANAAARAEDSSLELEKIGTDTVTSLNYLGAMLVEAAGLPGTVHQKYLEHLRETLPAVNLNGYQDATGTWHWFEEEIATPEQAAAQEALDDYAIVQYDDLFRKNSPYKEG
ncbi:LTA synthase family protein [uncultured Adlercreutzia sp.]|uniref:LTA synthase family protein n=1 Tax=uncultured Adlercreutzia sp. TaxID=875803 RepID=UPI0025F3534A|nr:LTA synthase family protein [uncultured Adlercreutzia sp.]MCI9261826.1 LTA synthase family protein [Eggerthellaceae bacterium]